MSHLLVPFHPPRSNLLLLLFLRFTFMLRQYSFSDVPPQLTITLDERAEVWGDALGVDEIVVG